MHSVNKAGFSPQKKRAPQPLALGICATKHFLIFIIFVFSSSAFSLEDLPSNLLGDGGSCTYSEIIIVARTNGEVWANRKLVNLEELPQQVLGMAEKLRIDCIVVVGEYPLEKKSEIILEVEKSLIGLNQVVYFYQEPEV
ncbi:hypothetical protein [Aurantivibrio plasticivorans]